ncbi:MAG: agmatinase [Alphaproteobacteria bacterium]|nr:agmatinase [Alphaproteobacteria bacterium]NDC56205.1 agmatinase [Alphaproteobacteria bacterium]
MTLSFLPPARGFLGLPPSAAFSASQAKSVLIPFGLEQSVSYEGGTAQGPQAIIDCSPQLELFDDELWREPHEAFKPMTAKPVKISASLPKALDQLEALVDDVLEAGKFPMIMGGEHSLTAGSIRPFAKRHQKLTIMHFDAHADLRDGYEGETYSHAAALRRCLDFPHVRLVSVGIRNISKSEIPFLEKNKKRITVFWAREKAEWTVAKIMKAIGSGPVYVTFDIDAFDSSLIPATGTPEPGGLFWDETMDILRATFTQKNVVGADVVELSPRPGLHACNFLAAKLVFKMLAYQFCLSRHAS